MVNEQRKKFKVTEDYKKRAIEAGREKLPKAEKIRNQVHNLVLPRDIEIYNQHLEEFLIIFEGMKPKAYDDKQSKKDGKKKGKITVGIGFNMDAPGAKDEWEEVFDVFERVVDPKKKIAEYCSNQNNPFKDIVCAFRDVYSGHYRDLTRSEMEQLLWHHLNNDKKKLLKIYSEDLWNKFSPNIQLAIQDMYYNLPALVRERTAFCGHIKKYAETGDTKDLAKAIDEVKNHSNAPYVGNESTWAGVQVRRNAQAIMLDDTACPKSPEHTQPPTKQPTK